MWASDDSPYPDVLGIARKKSQNSQAWVTRPATPGERTPQGPCRLLVQRGSRTHTAPTRHPHGTARHLRSGIRESSPCGLISPSLTASVIPMLERNCSKHAEGAHSSSSPEWPPAPRRHRLGLVRHAQSRARCVRSLRRGRHAGFPAPGE